MSDEPLVPTRFRKPPPTRQQPKVPGKVRKTIAHKVPKNNACLYLGPGSAVDTELSFASFFDGDHTIAGWFMPQYAPAGGHGPLFASSGPGRYFVGQGDYRAGNVINGKLAPGVSAKVGDQVLTVHLGNDWRIYLAPEWQAGVWHHVAVVRKEGTVRLYLNGKLLTPVMITPNYTVDPSDGTQKLASKTVTPASELSVPQSFKGVGLGNLRLGRARHPTLSANAQAYGLLDDVGVFTKDLTPSELSTLIGSKRLQGSEPGLLAGWGFDLSSPDDGPLPAKLAGSTTRFKTVDVKVSATRNSAVDSDALSPMNALVWAIHTPFRRLPFASGEAWKVTQGYCDPLVTHNGDSAAFCYDFVRAEGNTVNAPVYSSTGGYVFQYLRNGTPKKASNYREPNQVWVYTEAVDLVVSYLHFAGDSLTSDVVDGDAPLADPDDIFYLWPTVERWIAQGKQLGAIGPNAAHIHVGAKDTFVDPSFPLGVQLGANTMPMGFTNLEVKLNGEGNWLQISPYVPGKDDWVRAL